MKSLSHIQSLSLLLRRAALGLAFSLAFSGCYAWHASYNQMRLQWSRIPIKEALKKHHFSAQERSNLQLAAQLKDFAKTELEMNIDEDIYSSYIHLDRPYVTWLLRVSRQDELKAYIWNFPPIGSFPYKGFFSKEEAEAEERSFDKKKYDTYIRGVIAYSTLGWFEDAILSSMLSLREEDFAALIFHELAHTVLFFKSQVDFNERFAEFVGRKAAVMFFLKRDEAAKAAALRQGWEDELIFSAFMRDEYQALQQWYQSRKGHFTQDMKRERIRQIQDKFISHIQPRLKTSRYDHFPQRKLNNAKLLSYRSYNYNMDEFERLFEISGGSLKAFIEKCSEFKKAKDPEKALSDFLQKRAGKAPGL